MVMKEEDAKIEAPKDNLQQGMSPDAPVHVSHASQEVNTPPTVPEKPPEDGYNWRKYGQKNVKGNESIRSYYKCSYPNCLVKKQVERSHAGQITDITYLGKHEHVKCNLEPLEIVPSLPSVDTHTPTCPPAAGDEDKPSEEHTPTTENVELIATSEHPTAAVPNHAGTASFQPSDHSRNDHNENLTPKKRKKGVDDADMMDKPGHESRVVIRTVSEVDIVNDGYRWRKYGQKMVKGNSNPRSYYRCSTTGCPVKKHVERASHDSKVVITTYEGQHEHNKPPVRTVVSQATTPTAGETELNGIGKSQSNKSDAVSNGSGMVTCKVEENYSEPTTKEEIRASNIIKTEPETKEEIRASNIIKTEPEITPIDQEMHSKTHKIESFDQTVKESSDAEGEVEIKFETEPEKPDPICKTSSSDKTEQTVEHEKVSSVQGCASIEQQRPSSPLESSHQKANSNGQQVMDTEPVNC